MDWKELNWRMESPTMEVVIVVLFTKILLATIHYLLYVLGTTASTINMIDPVGILTDERNEAWRIE